MSAMAGLLLTWVSLFILSAIAYWRWPSTRSARVMFTVAAPLLVLVVGILNRRDGNEWWE